MRACLCQLPTERSRTGDCGAGEGITNDILPLPFLVDDLLFSLGRAV
jgi:hypothetical protein